MATRVFLCVCPVWTIEEEWDVLTVLDVSKGRLTG